MSSTRSKISPQEIFSQKIPAKKIFALVDCNNFYASCERAFNPALRKKPIVILSNNDGCIIARSNEAKALGIPMGAPFFKHKQFIAKNNVAVFSSNYQLYGDMSARVMKSLRMFVADIEIYSIDEAFLRLDKMAIENIDEFAKDISQKVFRWTGIPISIGIAPTKTLAKLANNIAKKNPAHQGVFNICGKNLDEEFKKMPVNEIWGIARGSELRLSAVGISSIYDLKNAQQKLVGKTLGVVGERIALELNGVSCLELEEVAPRKQIISSRSFGEKQTEFAPIAQALANYASHACSKLRAQKSRAAGLCVYIRTNFYGSENSYSNSISIAFENPQSDVRIIVAKAKECLEKIFRKGYRYHKAGVILFDISPENNAQDNLFGDANYEKSDKLMKLIDGVNDKSKAEILFFAAQGTKRVWQMKKDLRSQCYTRFNEMLKIA